MAGDVNIKSSNKGTCFNNYLPCWFYINTYSSLCSDPKYLLAPLVKNQGGCSMQQEKFDTWLSVLCSWPCKSLLTQLSVNSICKSPLTQLCKFHLSTSHFTTKSFNLNLFQLVCKSPLTQLCKFHLSTSHFTTKSFNLNLFQLVD